jgi:hypothetical protein
MEDCARPLSGIEPGFDVSEFQDSLNSMEQGRHFETLKLCNLETWL